MMFLGRSNDDVDDTREAATALAALFHCTIELARHDQLPWIISQHLFDDGDDVSLGNVVATADDHLENPLSHQYNSPLNCQCKDSHKC